MPLASGSAERSITGRTKWSATYTRYFALGMQLSPALQSPLSFHLGVVMLEKTTKKNIRNEKYANKVGMI